MLNGGGWRRYAEVGVAAATLAIVAMVAVPREGLAVNAQREHGVREGLAILRTAIEMYYGDHGYYPGQCDDCSPEAVIAQLTMYNDANGQCAESRDAEFRFGPYLRLGVPANPLAITPDADGILVVQSGIPTLTPGATEAGWIYCCQTGEIIANSPGVDGLGLAYERY